MQKNLVILKTEDGSATLFRPDINEHYHSTHGAITESQHVFIKMGIEQATSNTIRILEVGLGTGLNALLTALWAQENKRNITYHGYELYPLGKDITEQLHYPNMSNSANADELFQSIHAMPWGVASAISEYMTLTKINEDILSAQFECRFDVVYFDAFAPNKQEEIWSEELFEKIANNMVSNGIFTTYCAKGAVKRMLQAVGLSVKKVPGPPGKREMLTARKL